MIELLSGERRAPGSDLAEAHPSTTRDRSLALSCVAVRGESFALLALGSLGAGRTSAEATELVLFGPEGDRGEPSSERFDPADIGAALDELDRRYFATLDAKEAELAESLCRFARAYQSCDPAQLRDAVDEDVVLIDHRRASIGNLTGSDALVEYVAAFQRQLTELAVYVADIVCMSPPFGVVLLALMGTSQEGVEVDMTLYELYEIRDRRHVRQELFPFDDRAGVLARFEELCGAKR